MAAVSMWSLVSSKSHVNPNFKRIGQIEEGKIGHCPLLQKYCKHLPARLIGETDGKLAHQGFDSSPVSGKRQAFCLVYNTPSLLRKPSDVPLLKVYNIEGDEKFSSEGSHQRDAASYESDCLGTSSCGRQLKELDSYFNKLHCSMEEQPRSSENSSDTKEYRMESSSQLEGQQAKNDISNPCKRKATLDSLEKYFGGLNTVQHSRRGSSSRLHKENAEGNPIRGPHSSVEKCHDDTMTRENNSVTHLQNMDDEVGNVSSASENFKSLLTNEEASDFCLINLLVAINIAVFLFEIASPIRNTEVENLSLPLIYGAKINKLILVGEWWRLLTPMFLHSGFLHIALSSWVLLTFGPQVCRGYGPFTFLLIYVLGGICGNLTSFVHTPELTVCGTGPVFAIIGAWLVYQIQNKQVLTKELSESLFWKAVTATALSFLLNNFWRIDDWTHLGAACSGIIFGYLTSPSLQFLDNVFSLKDGQKQEGFASVQRRCCKNSYKLKLSRDEEGEKIAGNKDEVNFPLLPIASFVSLDKI
ncbi:RHOMBOID-like protein 9, chloroplastic isoform X1 [Asparagus officinalis]|uniref:RHOMBOID-like protein 9, chloroplastic isoform X1 n=1 Tax=Asparagus officinalis TaxID=4686 RepID=UPI00098E5EC0|nr:RHOMBOID-like protein 9, chloroplastic isoform X1 [Asparagus officinalis]